MAVKITVEYSASLADDLLTEEISFVTMSDEAIKLPVLWGSFWVYQHLNEIQGIINILRVEITGGINPYCPNCLHKGVDFEAYREHSEDFFKKVTSDLL
jgi:hypothetical protein